MRAGSFVAGRFGIWLENSSGAIQPSQLGWLTMKASKFTYVHNAQQGIIGSESAHPVDVWGKTEW